jgi:predicted N-acetyltransferase YhbS
MTTITIRPERAEDHPAVRIVHRKAFGDDRVPDLDEKFLMVVGGQ